VPITCIAFFSASKLSSREPIPPPSPPPPGAGAMPGTVPGIGSAPAIPGIMFGSRGIDIGGREPAIPAGIPIGIPAPTVDNSDGIAPIAGIGGAAASRTKSTIIFFPASSRPLIAACASFACAASSNVTTATPIDGPSGWPLAVCTSMPTTAPNGAKTSLRSAPEMWVCSSETTSFVGSAASPKPIMSCAGGRRR